MKIPKARQLPSGSWFIQLRIDGQSIPVTESTEDRCEAKAYAIKAGLFAVPRPKRTDKTLGTLFDNYVDLCRPSRSPSTVRGYAGIRKNAFPALMDKPLSAVTEDSIQREIDAMVRDGKSPKTIKNAYTLLLTVLSHNKIHLNTDRIKIPAPVPSDKKHLQKDEIFKFIAALDDYPPQIKAALLMAMRMSMRRGEICALEWEDFDKDLSHVHITKAVALNDKNERVVKRGAKNAKSNRTLDVPKWIQDSLAEAEPDEKKRKGAIFKDMHPNKLWRYSMNACKKAGITQVGIHELRHSFAAISGSLGIPKRVTMKMGGWSNEQTLNNVYDYDFAEDVAAANKTLDNFFENKPKRAKKASKKPKKK